MSTRNRELVNLIAVGVITGLGFASVYIARQDLITHRYEGFFIGMDTFKEKQLLDDMYSRGETPWEVWKTPAPAAP